MTDHPLPYSAQAGFNRGDGIGFYALPGSGTSEILALGNTSYINVSGVWLFRVDEDVSIGGKILMVCKKLQLNIIINPQRMCRKVILSVCLLPQNLLHTLFVCLKQGGIGFFMVFSRFLVKRIAEISKLNGIIMNKHACVCMWETNVSIPQMWMSAISAMEAVSTIVLIPLVALCAAAMMDIT